MKEVRQQGGGVLPNAHGSHLYGYLLKTTGPSGCRRLTRIKMEDGGLREAIYECLLKFQELAGQFRTQDIL
jgi:hypothetical protein